MRAFADTFFFLAFLSPSDEWHEDAVALMDQFAGQLVTTEWVLVELADAMADPRDRTAGSNFIDALRSDPDVRIVQSGTSLFEHGLKLYKARSDKRWSLTDCISFVVMEQEGLREAVSGDHHFEQAGFVTLMK
jgi:predicted nucleic acid-binding protein